MNIHISSAASQRMRDFLARSPDAAGVRFGVRQTGCSGFAYVVELAQDRRHEEDTVMVDGIPLIVDTRNMPLLEGTSIDFRREGLNVSFVFDNPNATGGCGCGESFSVA